MEHNDIFSNVPVNNELIISLDNIVRNDLTIATVGNWSPVVAALVLAACMQEVELAVAVLEAGYILTVSWLEEVFAGAIWSSQTLPGCMRLAQGFEGRLRLAVALESPVELEPIESVLLVVGRSTAAVLLLDKPVWQPAPQLAGLRAWQRFPLAFADGLGLG